jgi:hypothetical protein
VKPGGSGLVAGAEKGDLVGQLSGGEPMHEPGGANLDTHPGFEYPLG